MAVHFNHTILSAHNSKASAIFLAEMLNFPAPRHWGPFQMVVTENGANLDYMDTDGEITSQHYAFLISEAEFDEIFGRIRDRKLSYWADPGRRQLREINHHDGGRGVYFEDPNGHLLEIITRPYVRKFSRNSCKTLEGQLARGCNGLASSPTILSEATWKNDLSTRRECRSC